MSPPEDENDAKTNGSDESETGLVTVPQPAGLLEQTPRIADLDRRVTEALEAWLVRTPSVNTRENYSLDLNQFLDFVAIPSEHLGRLAAVRPIQVAAWRDSL